MRITMVGSLPPIKGMSAYCLQLVQALSKVTEIDFINFKSIYPPIIYPIEPTEDDKVFKAKFNANVKVDSKLRWYNPIGSCFTGLTVKNDLLHFHWWTSFLFIVFFPVTLFAKLRGKKIICTAHNVLGHESSFIDRVLCRLMLSIPDKVIVHSEKNREQLSSLFNIAPENISVIPHGRYDFYADETVSQTEAKKVLGVDTKTKMILFFGHVRDYKGLDTLLHALAAVRQKVPNLKCVVAGKNWASWEPYQKIIDDDNLHDVVDAQLDYVPSSRVKYLYSAADVVVLPYKHFDSQSGPGNIGLGFGRPLIVSNVGGLPDLVRNKEVVFEPDDAGGLANALTKVLTDADFHTKLTNDSLELREIYSWDSIAVKTKQLYETLLNGKA